MYYTGKKHTVLCTVQVRMLSTGMMCTVLFYRQDVYSIVYGTGPNVYNFDYYTGTMCMYEESCGFS
jgi:hypothetical protein